MKDVRNFSGQKVRLKLDHRIIMQKIRWSRWHCFQRSFTFFVALLVLLSANTLEAHSPNLYPEKRITVIELGALITMSDTGDPDTQAAIQLAIQDVNIFFRVCGQGHSHMLPLRVLLMIEGTGLDPAVALEKIQLLAASELHVVIGPESSAEVETIAPFANANDMVVLSHCSTAPSLAIPGDNVYRMVPSDLHQASAIAGLIFGAGYRAIVPMWRAGVWGDDISSAAGQQFATLGGVVYSGVRFDPESTDFSENLASLNTQVAEARAVFGDSVAVAFFSFGTEGAKMLAQAAEIPALGTVKWYGSDGTALSREILGDPKAAQFAIQTGFFNTLFAEVHTPKADAIRERIRAAIGGGDVHFRSVPQLPEPKTLTHSNWHCSRSPTGMRGLPVKRRSMPRVTGPRPHTMCGPSRKKMVCSCGNGYCRPPESIP